MVSAPMVTARDVRDRLREESVRMQKLVDKEMKRPPNKRRQHIVDGLQVASQVLRRLAAQLAEEAQHNEILEVAFDDDDDCNPAGP